MWCIVNLPNGTQQAVKWDPKAIGQECLEKVRKTIKCLSMKSLLYKLIKQKKNTTKTKSKHYE